MSKINAKIGQPNSQRRWSTVRILLYLILVCAILPLFVLMVTWGNDVHYQATTAPLQKDDNIVRENSIRSLRRGGPEAAHSLGRALRDDPDARVREGAARALVEFAQATLDRGYNLIPDLRNAINGDVREATSDVLEGR